MPCIHYKLTVPHTKLIYARCTSTGQTPGAFAAVRVPALVHQELLHKALHTGGEGVASETNHITIANAYLEVRLIKESECGYNKIKCC